MAAVIDPQVQQRFLERKKALIDNLYDLFNFFCYSFRHRMFSIKVRKHHYYHRLIHLCSD